MLFLKFNISYIFLHTWIYIFLYFFSETKLWNIFTEIPYRLKHFSLEPNRNGVRNEIDSYDAQAHQDGETQEKYKKKEEIFPNWIGNQQVPCW